MKLEAWAARRATAENQIAEYCRALGERFALPSSATKPFGNLSRGPQTRALQVTEACAETLRMVLEATAEPVVLRRGRAPKES